MIMAQRLYGLHYAGNKQLTTHMRLSSLLLFVLMSYTAASSAQSQVAADKTQTPSTSPGVAEANRLLAAGQLDQSLEQLDKLAAIHPEAAGVESLRGMVFYQQGKMSEAAEAFGKAVAQDPKDFAAMQMQGVSLFRQGNAAGAIPLLEKAHSSISTANVDPNYVLGLCYMDTRRYDDARHAFATQYGFGIDSAQAYLLAARLFLRREYLPIAETSARKALELDPSLPLAHLLLGEVALAGSRSDEALAQFNQEAALNPLYGGVYERLADAYMHTGDYDHALTSLNKAVLLEPSSTGPYILLGKVFLKQKNPLMARLYLERAVNMDPGNYMAHGLLGQAYRSLGRPEDAAREMQKTTEIQAATTPKFENPK